MDNYRVVGLFLETTNGNLANEVKEILAKNGIKIIAVIDSHDSFSFQSTLGHLMDQLLKILKHKGN